MFKTGNLSAISNSKIFGSTLALLKVGQSSPTVTLSTKSFTLSLATSVGISSSNSIFIIDIPSLDVDSISISPITPLISCSNGSVINFSISSALFPGKIVVTKIFEELISGNNSLGIVLYAVIPENKKIVIKT